MFAPVARWREYGQRETSGLPGFRLFVPMETSLCHPPQDQYLGWDNCHHRENSPAFSSQPRKKVRKNGSFRGQPVVGCEPRRLVSWLPLRGAWLPQLDNELDASQASPTVGSVKRRPLPPPTDERKTGIRVWKTQVSIVPAESGSQSPF